MTPNEMKQTAREICDNLYAIRGKNYMLSVASLAQILIAREAHFILAFRYHHGDAEIFKMRNMLNAANLCAAKALSEMLNVEMQELIDESRRLKSAMMRAGGSKINLDDF